MAKTKTWLKSKIPIAIIILLIIAITIWMQHSIKNSYDLYTPVIQGIIGGIITAFIILIFSIAWKSNITPWFENIVYKDTKIEGEWEGVLVPYLGIKEIDQLRKKAAINAMNEIFSMTRSNQAEQEETIGSKEMVSAKIITEDGEQEIKAEMLPDDEAQESDGEKIKRKKFIVKVKIGSSPIKIRINIKRLGHSINGQIIEIGGASQIHTYDFVGTFKNMILNGTYENSNRQFVDRGSLSLMLTDNGRCLEGYFSSYADSRNSIFPFKCIIKRHGLTIAST